MEELYTLITSSRYQGEGEGEMIEDIITVRNFLIEEAKMLGLKGPVEEIHWAVTITELDNFTQNDFETYSTLFARNYTTKEEVIKMKYRNLELLRYHNFVTSVLFGKHRKEFVGQFTFLTPPTVTEVQDNGILYYYNRVGNVTIEDLTERYEQYEMQRMAGLLAYIGGIPYTARFYKSEEMAAVVHHMLDILQLDNRIILTPVGPFIIHRGEHNLNYLNDTTMIEEAMREGVFAHGRTLKDIYHEFILVQLQPNFYIGPDIHRFPIEMVRNQHTTLGETLAEVNPIFYGVGDGIELYDFFSERELYQTFIQEGAVHPVTKIPFPEHCLRKLIAIANDLELVNLIRQKMDERGILPLLLNVNTTREDLITIYNAGLFLVDWYENSAIADISEEVILLHPDDRLMDPLAWRSLRDSMRSWLLKMEQGRDLDKLWRMDINGDHYYVDTTNVLNTIEGTIELMYRTIALNYFPTMEYLARQLVIASNYYMQALFGIQIVETRLDFVIED